MNLLVELATVDCCSCHATFAMTNHAKDNYRESHKWFWCPYCGNHQHFPQKTALEQSLENVQSFRRLLTSERARHDQTKADRDHEKRRRASMQGVVTKTKKRISKGICPCCNRYFKNLHRHMSSQHPEYK